MSWPDLAVLGAVAATFAVIAVLRRRRANFALVTLGALAIGVPIGLLAQGHVDYVEPIGRIYLNMLLASVAPLVFVSIIASIVSLGSVERLRSVGLRSVFWLMISNAIAVVLALGIGLASGTGSGLNRGLGGEELSVLENSVQDFTQVVVGFFPSSVVDDFGSNRILPIIFVAVALAVAYLQVARKHENEVRPFRLGVEALRLVVYRAVGYVIRLTPYAVVALTAALVANSTDLGATLWSLLGLLVLVWITCLAHMFLVNAAILRVFADVSPVRFFRRILPAQLTALTTQSSVGTLPVTTDLLTRRIGVHPEVAHFTAPLGTTIGMPGCSGIWPVLVAVWGINAYGIDYGPVDYLVLALLATVVSVGTAGVPGTATVAAATVLAAAGLPLEFIAVTLPISMIADMARTATNVTAAAVSATVVAKRTGLFDPSVLEDDAAPEAAVTPPAAVVASHGPAAPAAPAVHEPTAQSTRRPTPVA